MIGVKVMHNDIENALRKLKKKIKDSNLIMEMQKREFYRKPSEINREKKHKAKARQLQKI